MFTITDQQVAPGAATSPVAWCVNRSPSGPGSNWATSSSAADWPLRAWSSSGWTLLIGVVLAITIIGLAVLGLSDPERPRDRGWHRRLARSMLGEPVQDPEPFDHRRGFFGWLGAALRDRAGWRSVGYLLIKVPWTVLGFYVVFSLWWDAVGLPPPPVPLQGDTIRKPRDLRPGPRYFPARLLRNNGSNGFRHDLGLFVRASCSSWPRRG